MNRKMRIYSGLEWAKSKGIIRDYQCQSQMPGLRWTIEGYGFTSRAYRTNEVEIFLLAASEGRTSGFLT